MFHRSRIYLLTIAMLIAGLVLASASTATAATPHRHRVTVTVMAAENGDGSYAYIMERSTGNGRSVLVKPRIGYGRFVHTKRGISYRTPKGSKPHWKSGNFEYANASTDYAGPWKGQRKALVRGGVPLVRLQGTLTLLRR